MKVIIYARKEDAVDDESGPSISSQTEEITRWALEHGHEIVGEFASTVGFVSWLMGLGEIDRDFDAIVTTHQDRISPSSKDYGEFHRWIQRSLC
jgi:hypothetical protein